MALLDWMSEPVGPVLRGHGVILRAPHPSDYVAWSTVRGASRSHLQPWEPAWPEDDLTRTAFRRRLSIYERERELGNAWPFFIFDQEDRLAGGITLSNVRRGVAETGTVGYWVGLPHGGRGLATASLRVLSTYAFGTLGLHRLEAACVPTNQPSRRVLEKAGFRLEGRARAYLKINGTWADHLLFGLLAEEAGADGRLSS